jgi:two-component system, chemotaxis family, chemotaxis protein CheY
MKQPIRQICNSAAVSQESGINQAADLFQPRAIIMKRLLVVDDALFMRKMICGVAVEAGWQVVGEACNGVEAVSLYQQHRPDLVTMDLVMPIMGGLEALRQIRAGDPDAKVVVVTALDQKQSLMDSIRDGAIDFIVKPFERERVLALLAKLERTESPSTPRRLT